MGASKKNVRKPAAPPETPPPEAPAAPLAQETPPAAPAIRETPLHRVRPWELGLVVALCLALYLPLLGNYVLWDPWETHYGEVARRMLEEHDWVRLKWQDEPFHSKPVLTFWMMAASMKLLGVGADGGFSGEFISSSRVEWALRLPFALWGVVGLVLLWVALARLYLGRAAWLATAVLATCPFYFMISRQAITDMPSCAMLVGSIALLALAIFDDQPLRRWRYGLNAHHLFLVALAIVVLPQLVYFAFYLQGARWMITPRSWIPGPWMMLPFALGFVAIAIWSALTCKTRRQAYMYWFYLLSGFAVLAKGPPAPAVAGLTIIAYLLVTGDWRLLARLEILRGVLVGALICLPWHFAIFMKDGMGWLRTYIGEHLLGRAFRGMQHAPRGTFEMYAEQLGAGMWPWICFVPIGLAAVLVAGRPRTREEKLRAMFALWGIVAFAFFSFVITKFNHYILPAVPGLAVVAALWLNDVWEGRASGTRVALFVAAALFVVTAFDVVSRQERLVHLFTYRYDRPWPYAAPWSITFAPHLAAFAALFGAGLVAAFFTRARRFALPGLVAVAVAFAAFAMDVLLPAASPHWGQRTLHEVYYKKRRIFGIDLTYYGPGALVREWSSGKDLEVRSVIPHTLEVGDPMKITWELRNANEGVQEKGELAGAVASIDTEGHRFTIAVPAEERAKLDKVLADNRNADDRRRRFVAVNAERLIAYSLYWRGENFYSGGEIWNPRNDDMKTTWGYTLDDSKFLAYVNERSGSGRTFWAVSEKGKIPNLRRILPTEAARQSVEDMDNSSNKFGLARFRLDP